jgi:hypothetical protein
MLVAQAWPFSAVFGYTGGLFCDRTAGEDCKAHQGEPNPNPHSANPIQSGLRISSPYHAKQSRTWFDARGLSIPATMLWQ